MILNCWKSKSTTNPFEKAWGIHIQGTAALNLLGGTILAGLLIHDVTRHKHGDEVTSGEAALISLRKRRGNA